MTKRQITISIIGCLGLIGLTVSASRWLEAQNLDLALRQCEPRLEEREIDGNSMHGLVEAGDRVWVEFDIYACEEPRRDDLVVVSKGADPRLSVKRLAGIPGDEISVLALGQKSILYINNSIVTSHDARPLLLSPASAEMFRQIELAWHGRIPPDRYFVFGTKSVGSVDSTEWEPVTREELVGRLKKAPSPSSDSEASSPGATGE